MSTRSTTPCRWIKSSTKQHTCVAGSSSFPNDSWTLWRSPQSSIMHRLLCTSPTVAGNERTEWAKVGVTEQIMVRVNGEFGGGGYWAPYCSTLTTPLLTSHEGTAAAVPSSFRLGDPALCGSHPLVTPYYCRLGILGILCFLYVCVYCVHCIFCVIFVFLQYFDTVGWLFWPVKRSLW